MWGNKKTVDWTKEEKHNKQFVLNAVSKKGCLLEFASKTLRDDEEVVTAALESDKRVLKYASKRLRSIKEFVYPWVESFSYNFEFISKDLRADVDMFHLLIERSMFRAFTGHCHVVNVSYKNSDGSISKYDFLFDMPNYISLFHYVTIDWKKHRDLLLESITIHEGGQWLRHLPEYQSDKEIILQAFKSSPVALSYLSQEIYADTDFIKSLIDMNPVGFIYLPEEWKSKEELILELLPKLDLYRYIPKQMQEKDNIIWEVTNHWPNSIDLIITSHGDKLSNEYYEYLAENHPSQFGKNSKYFPKRIRNNSKLMLRTIENCSSAFKTSSSKLRNDREFVLQALEKNADCFKEIPSIFREDIEIVVFTLSKNMELIKYLSNEKKNDPNFIHQLMIHFGKINFPSISKKVLSNAKILCKPTKKPQNVYY